MNIKNIVLCVILALNSPLVLAQTAKVIVLSAEDTKEASEIHKLELDLEKRKSGLHDRIIKSYLTLAKPSNGNQAINPNSITNITGLTYGTLFYNYKEGWESGEFSFTEDFRFIVPKPSFTPTYNSCTYCIYNSNYCYSGGAYINGLSSVQVTN